MLLDPSKNKYEIMNSANTNFTCTVSLIVLQVDISNHTQMSSLKDRLQTLPDVVGIVHTAMVLRDEFIKDLKLQSFNEVMGPKIKGKTLPSRANSSFLTVIS